MKKIFKVSGGLQQINQNIENESFSPIAIRVIDAPDDVTSLMGFTTVYSDSIESLVESLDEAFADQGISFSTSEMDGEILLDINP